jgi:hypothetical protein
MFTGVCVSSISRGKRLRTNRVAGLFLVLFFVSGILYATPILDQSAASLQNARHRPGFLVLNRGKSALHLAAARSVQSFATASAQQPSSGCFFAGNCSNPVHIPEPAALAVLGMGLLLISGLLRRRLTRRIIAR